MDDHHSSGRHPFERQNGTREEMVKNIVAADYTFDSAQWTGISGRARELVRQLLEPDPDKRITAGQLLTHPWVRGEGVPERPLPDTVERLRAFKTASAAIHGSLLMAALLYQENVREQLAQSRDRKKPWGGWGYSGNRLLRRSTTEGIGMLQPSEDFNVVRAAFQLFDPEDKGHITADDLYRVCTQLGFQVSERDIENMLSILAPSYALAPAEVRSGKRSISFDKFAKMMENSYQRQYKVGEHIFKQGDAVDGFFIVVSGECAVQVSARPGDQPQEIANLGPGDFFGETGLLEGRETRNTDVLCRTPVSVLMISNAMFLQLTSRVDAGSAGAAVAARMRERAEKRQRSRLNRAIEMMQNAKLKQMKFKPGEIVFEQGDSATHFYIVKAGKLSSSFLSTTGESAELSVYTQGDQFGYDSVLGEVHDTTVRCLTAAEVLAVPRDQMQKAFMQDTYLRSVWQAPSKRAIALRRQTSMNLVDAEGSRVGSRPGGAVDGGEADGVDRLSRDDFEPIIRRARMCSLAPGEVAFEQGSVPNAIYLLRDGRCEVEHSSKVNRETMVVGTLSAGDHFGEGALLENRNRRNSTVRCVDPAGCTVGVLGKGAFEALLRSNPEISDVFAAANERRNRSRLRKQLELAVQRSECTTRELRQGEVLFKQGELAEAFFMVESGAIEISKRTADGRHLPSRTHKAGEIFGSSGLLTGDSTRQDTATAIQPTVLKAIPHAHFTPLMRQDSLLAEDLKRASSLHRGGGGGANGGCSTGSRGGSLGKARGTA
uniref:cGMP-dependent protein kinase n=1 Tax=Haptolina brevifila TaxID=156173 RepID=A0A7S2IWR8_9EUKA|mmetsp:Transcript_72351/g.143642  ORF Transcript_72351/g.143642 Transcript_72351/m.143642 type:complete len:773 (+) Transcript_72351:48-2366(+)